MSNPEETCGKVEAAVMRVAEFIRQRSSMGGTNKEVIYIVHSDIEAEQAFLNTSDIETLITAAKEAEKWRPRALAAQQDYIAQINTVKALRAQIAALQSGYDERSAMTEKAAAFIVKQDEKIKALSQRPDAWQPIETAPRDGTHILVCRWPVTGRWSCNKVYFGSGRFHSDRWLLASSNPLRYDPTHWQPLPAPPQPDKEG